MTHRYDPNKPRPEDRIVRIISVLDTRSYEEIGDKWVAIAGSGNPRPCDRCGKEHEVHVDVELADGRVFCIGTGCARGESVEENIKAGAASAKRLRQLEYQRETAVKKYEEAERIYAEVEKLPLPPVVMEEREETVGRAKGSKVTVAVMEDVTVWLRFSEGFNQERRECLVDHWREARRRERCLDWRPPYLRKEEIDHIDKQIKKVKAKLEALNK